MLVPRDDRLRGCVVDVRVLLAKRFHVEGEILPQTHAPINENTSLLQHNRRGPNSKCKVNGGSANETGKRDTGAVLRKAWTHVGTLTSLHVIVFVSFVALMYWYMKY
jgi:hypothetical protein